MAQRKKKQCRSCGGPLGPTPARGVVRCVRCAAYQPRFKAWLRGDSPSVYTPRTDGVWADVRKPNRDE